MSKGPCSSRQKERMIERRAELEAKGLCVNCARNKAGAFTLNARYNRAVQKYCYSCAVKRSEAAKSRLKAVRAAVLDLYGAECACCGETEPIFLTIDHINNDGHKERGKWGRNLTSSEMICRRLLKQKRDDIQILCYNCNCGKQRAGKCPHTG